MVKPYISCKIYAFPDYNLRYQITYFNDPIVDIVDCTGPNLIKLLGTYLGA